MSAQTSAPVVATGQARDARGLILAATQKLLQSRRLDELTVVELIEAAGVSRATFYVHFESKYAAVAAQAEGLMGEIHALWSPWLAAPQADGQEALETLWCESLGLWRRHRDVLMAAAEGWRADTAVAGFWCVLMSGYAETVRHHIEAARAAGSAPAGPDAQVLAAVLVWLNESAMYLLFASEVPDQAGDRELARTLAAIWMRTIYGEPRPRGIPVAPAERDPPAPAAPRPGARMRRTGNATVREAILVATAELLRERPLEQLTAIDVIEAAGYSRPTFYMYFGSKNAAVAALADQLLGELFERFWAPSFDCVPGADPPGTIEHFAATLAGWRGHREALIAGARGWRCDPVGYAAWRERLRSFVAITADYVERARAVGAAAPEPDAPTLATLLISLTETIFYLTLSELDSALVDDADVAAALSAVWLRAIHSDPS